ncbi:hypothetical protein PFISCL1PPCAC_8472, partial [Pristionchus fissidentatus]
EEKEEREVKTGDMDGLEKISISLFNNSWTLLRTMQHARVCKEVPCHHQYCSLFKRLLPHIEVCGRQEHARKCGLARILLAHDRKEHAQRKDDNCPLCRQVKAIYRRHPGKAPRNYEEEERKEQEQDNEKRKKDTECSSGSQVDKQNSD